MHWDTGILDHLALRSPFYKPIGHIFIVIGLHVIENFCHIVKCVLFRVCNYDCLELVWPGFWILVRNRGNFETGY